VENLTPSDVALLQTWNKFLESIIDLEKQWNSLVELRTAPGFHTDRLPAVAGKFFGLATSRSAFLVALPRLLDYARKYTCLNDMIVQLPTVEKKEVTNARARR
jgi:hypothetical protein